MHRILKFEMNAAVLAPSLDFAKPAGIAFFLRSRIAALFGPGRVVFKLIKLIFTKFLTVIISEKRVIFCNIFRKK